MNLLTQTKYFDSLINAVDTSDSGDRVSLITMSIDHEDPIIQQLTSTLRRAATRGAQIHIGIDAYSLMFTNTARPSGQGYQT